MIDIHCHLLPGVDDGPAGLTEALAMCRLAAADGCEVLFATPHQRHPYWWNGDRELLAHRLELLRSELGDHPQVLAGAEVRVDAGLLADLECASGGSVLSLGGSRFLLLELDRRGLGPAPEDLLHELIVGGWQPIIAHPELYPWLAGSYDRLAGLVDGGARLQVTAASLTGDYGRPVQNLCRRLIDDGLVDFVASDAHGVERRPPGLSAAFRVLETRYGVETARALTSVNAQAIVESIALAPA